MRVFHFFLAISTFFILLLYIFSYINRVKQSWSFYGFDWTNFNSTMLIFNTASTYLLALIFPNNKIRTNIQIFDYTISCFALPFDIFIFPLLCGDQFHDTSIIKILNDETNGCSVQVFWSIVKLLRDDTSDSLLRWIEAYRKHVVVISQDHESNNEKNQSLISSLKLIRGQRLTDYCFSCV